MRTIVRCLIPLILLVPSLVPAQSRSTDTGSVERRGFAGGSLSEVSTAASLDSPGSPWSSKVQPVSVRNVDERGRVPYMQFAAVACDSADDRICAITFPAVPARDRLVLEHVNASVTFAIGGVKRAAVLMPGEALYVLPVHAMEDPDLVIVNESTLVFFESGESPVFQLVLTDGSDAPLVTAALSGYLVHLD